MSIVRSMMWGSERVGSSRAPLAAGCVGWANPRSIGATAPRLARVATLGCVLGFATFFLAVTGCAVVNVAGAAAGAAISVTGAVVSTGVRVTGKVIEKTIDVVTPDSKP